MYANQDPSRARLFGGGGGDVESGAGGSQSSDQDLERDNDAALNRMGDRVAMLRKITGDIHKEADSHHSLLDGIGNAMGDATGALSQTLTQFRCVLCVLLSPNSPRFQHLIAWVPFN
ncbi:uncharacterized protein MICPUCDRAFT_64586 [Micromonas pusilla CCMP1545]|uniref:Predicted protein n=1 Tax=Micromonas pusilla (strain CCMP1545) TaxID=564608 RepID=C1MKT0_MICPC|nr:uncharacterized protein MICPUCDRAFT_64586 [Micromonas pusilla CCMP1545]EEH59815.1 predicted protein [Micromonas pusilla CCMP1545]|eukprot:XP_003056439.1 predicted protein [Micromonas pusilla CCMP1545]